MASGQLSLPYWEVDGSGQITYTISTGERNSTRFVLFATAAGETVQATLSVTLTCPDVWFFSPAPEICPASAAMESAAAEEPFEQGTMIWVKEQDLIYVLFSDGVSPHWRAYQDRWNEGDPTNDPALEPPPGLFQPERGFGLVWREEPGVRDRLGWALAPEASYVTKVQATSRFKYNDLYVGALDGRVWMLKPEGSGWEIIAP